MVYYLKVSLFNGGIILIIGIVSKNNNINKATIMNVKKLVNIY